MSQNSDWKFNHTYSQLPESFFTLQNPDTAPDPKLVVWNEQLADELGQGLSKYSSKELADIFSGNKIPEGAKPLAQAYAGHQFGHFTMLGDGRAVLLGEVIGKDGKSYDIQLKGAGRTPYSRGGDGRGTLHSMLREYLMSESLYGLGIPTTRSLAVTQTGEQVFRQTSNEGGILTRVAQSHVRVGTFEYAQYFGSGRDVTTLIDYTIQRHYPELSGTENPPLELLDKVADMQIKLVIEWLRTGFIHGVMNTDNTSVSGQTIDYGPCAFMNAYDPATVFSSIDEGGRYAFGNQVKVIHWNLAVFAETLLGAIDEEPRKALEKAQAVINEIPRKIESERFKMMSAKLGIEKPDQKDGILIEGLLDLMKKYGADYTNTFRTIAEDNFSDERFYQSTDFKEWRGRHKKRIAQNRGGTDTAYTLMRGNNPAFIPRNHIVEKALEDFTEHNDRSTFDELLMLMSDPYKNREGFDDHKRVPAGFDRGYQTYCGT